MENKIPKSGDGFLDPRDIISQLEITPGSQVADFGCASGYFSIPFAEAVGVEGRVYAIDILPHVLDTVESAARYAGLANIETKRANLEKAGSLGIEKESLEWVILKDILFQNKNKEAILKEAYGVLKSGGRILVIEWQKEGAFIGPEKGLRISEDDLKKMAAEQGFVFEKELRAGGFHYAFVAVKK